MITRPSPPSRGGRLLMMLAAGLLAAPTAAHTDDPKGKDVIPPYVGPGYHASDATAGDPGFPAVGVNLLDWHPVGDFPGGGTGAANDCWGYVSPSGREYAIIGLECGTGFVDITTPGSSQVVGVISGPCCTWRDIKVYDEYAYVVSECGLGIQVVDLRDIDASGVDEQDVHSVGTGGSDSHNVAIDTTSGYLYRTGGSGYGLLIFDLANPANPQLVAQWSERYVHDAVVHTYTEGPNAGKQIAFCCSGFSGGWVEPGLDIVDVTDKNNIQVLARFIYENGAYSHQAWLSEDKTRLFLNDELDEDGTFPTTTFVFDVLDLDQPRLASTFTNGSLAIGHNLYVRGNLVLESNYTSGLRVFDASNPLSVTEIGYFDTRPEDDSTGFPGLWSNFPFFPSGTVIGSDRQRGLFVWEFDFDVEGDVNGDGSANFGDLLQILASWGACPPSCPEDLDGSGLVDFGDILYLLANWTG